jgi:hypothetical protein
MMGEADSEERPLSRLAFWRRHRAEETAPTASASDLPEPSRTPVIAGNGTAAGDDEERPGLLRRLPLVGRLWRGGERDESDELDRPAARYAPGVVNSQSVALARPRTPSSNASSMAPRRPSASETASPSPVADANPAATDPSPSPSPTTAAVGSDRPEDQPPLRELTVDLAEARPQVDSAAVPARNAGSPAPATPNVPDSQLQQGNLPEPPPIPSLGREAAPAPVASPGAQPNAATPDLMPAPTSRGPSLPSTSSPTVSSQPEPGSNPASGSLSTTVISTPGPLWPADGQTTFLGSSPSLVMSSSQGGYVSGGCESTCGPKCKIHKLCPLKKHKQVISSSVVLPSAQATISSCEATAPCKVKKPCFLKTWLHHKASCKSKGCKGCKTCSYCGESPTMGAAQGPIVSPQW